jgi:hypothetical protein
MEPFVGVDRAWRWFSNDADDRRFGKPAIPRYVALLKAAHVTENDL